MSRSRALRLPHARSPARSLYTPGRKALAPWPCKEEGSQAKGKQPSHDRRCPQRTLKAPNFLLLSVR